MDRQPVAVVASDDRHDRPVVGENHRNAHDALGDGDAGVASVRGLAVAEVPRDPPAALTDRTPPGEGEFDMLCGNAALGAATPGVRAEVRHHDLRVLGSKAEGVPARFHWFHRLVFSGVMQMDLAGESMRGERRREGGFA
ncbi:MAG TPA: hypothetical protein PKA64_16670 [Myxococcota bacterium]|nr:hypothetical protein [Myxococcota bacterium]